VTTLTGPVEHHVPPVGARFTVVEEHTVPTDVRLTSDNKVHKVSCANASNASSAFNAYCPPNKVRYADCSSVYFNVDTTELSIKKLVSTDVLASPYDTKKGRVFLIPIVNHTMETRTIREGKKVGQCLPVPPSPTPSLHHIAKPLKLRPLPDVSKLSSVDGIYRAIDDYIQMPPLKGKVLEQKVEQVHTLFQGQIKENKLLTTMQKQQTAYLLAQFMDVVSKSQYDVGCTDLLEFKVDTGDAKPIKDKTRPLNPIMVDNLKTHLNEQVAEGILAPGDGPWASALVPVRKKNGTWRYAVDYRRLNNVTTTDSYPIAHQLMATASEEFSKAKYFISIDLAGAYLAVPVEKESQDKLAVTTCEGLYKCLRMPFGAKNACGCYARLMRLIFQDMMDNRESMSFFDDHLITCPDFLSGLFRLAKFLIAIRKANLRISPKKTQLFVEKVDWLGFEATAGFLLPADSHIKVIKEWPIPRNQVECASFYGLAGYYRKFVKDFAKLAKPLKDLEHANHYEWTPACQQAFELLKEKLVSKPILAHPNFSDPNRPFILDTDASDWALGGVLSQIQADGNEHPVAFGSKSLSKAERHYSVTRKELMAVKVFMELYKYYLEGRRFLVRTDHKALVWLMTSMCLPSQLMRWYEAMVDFDFTISHRPGKIHQNADALSRYPAREETEWMPPLTDEDIAMYKKCNIKLPTTGHRARKMAGMVYYNTRSKARNALPVIEEEENIEEEVRQHSVQTRYDDENQVYIDEGLIEEEDLDEQRESQRLIGLDGKNDQPWTQMNQTHPTVVRREVHKAYNMASEQRKDPNLLEVIHWVVIGQPPKSGECVNGDLLCYAKKFKQLKVQEDKLYLIDNGRFRLCIPSHIISPLIRTLHHHPLAGHLGLYRTYTQARHSFYWPNMHLYIEKAIQACHACIKAKRRKADKVVPMGQTSTAETQRLRHWYADLVGPWFPKPLPGRNQYLLTLVDGVSKFPEAFPIYKATTEHILKCLLTEFLPRYGCGMKITTDNGSQFVSALFKEACSTLGVITATTQAYEPHSNPVERMHRTLEMGIRALMAQENVTNPLQWDSFVPCALASIRQSPLSNLPFSPHFLMYGEEAITPANVLTNHVPQRTLKTDANSSIQRLHKALVVAAQLNYRNHLKNKRNYDKKVHEKPLAVGDWVFLHQHHDPSRLGSLRKLAMHRAGPYLVLEIINPRQVRILVHDAPSKERPRGRNGDKVVSRDRLIRVPTWQISTLDPPLGWNVTWTTNQWRKSLSQLQEEYLETVDEVPSYQEHLTESDPQDISTNEYIDDLVVSTNPEQELLFNELSRQTVQADITNKTIQGATLDHVVSDGPNLDLLHENNESSIGVPQRESTPFRFEGDKTVTFSEPLLQESPLESTLDMSQPSPQNSQASISPQAQVNNQNYNNNDMLRKASVSMQQDYSETERLLQGDQPEYVIPDHTTPSPPCPTSTRTGTTQQQPTSPMTQPPPSLTHHHQPHSAASAEGLSTNVSSAQPPAYLCPTNHQAYQPSYDPAQPYQQYPGYPQYPAPAQQPYMYPPAQAQPYQTQYHQMQPAYHNNTWDNTHTATSPAHQPAQVNTQYQTYLAPGQSSPLNLSGYGTAMNQSQTHYQSLNNSTTHQQATMPHMGYAQPAASAHDTYPTATSPWSMKASTLAFQPNDGALSNSTTDSRPLPSMWPPSESMSYQAQGQMFSQDTIPAHSQLPPQTRRHRKPRRTSARRHSQDRGLGRGRFGQLVRQQHHQLVPRQIQPGQEPEERLRELRATASRGLPLLSHTAPEWYPPGVSPDS